MEHLNQALLNRSEFWEGKHVSLPEYDRKSLPVTAICFSMGRMGFGHFADIYQDLIHAGAVQGTIAGVETYAESYCDGLRASDVLTTQIIYSNQKGIANPKIQGAITEALFLSEDESSSDWARILELARDEKVRFATINAPEIVYGMQYSGGDFATPTAPKVIADMENGTVTSDPGKWTRFALERFRAGLNFAFVSCTNFSKNGFFTGAVLRTVGRAWEEKGYAPKGFLAYLSDKTRMGFPNTMVDRIAVAPDDAVAEIMKKLDLDSSVIVTEENRYWAIEDQFPGGRPDFEKAAGVFLCPDFEDVKKYEDLKLRALNMSHTVITSLGVMLGYRGPYGVYRGFQEPALRTIITKITDIVRKIVAQPAKLDVDTFIRDTFARVDNPNVPDDPMRIALNASTKILPRLMDTFWDGRAHGIPLSDLDIILIPVAGFLRYCTGVDDGGVTYEVADDPAKERMVACGSRALAGEPASEAFRPLLTDAHVMGRDLSEEPEILARICQLTDAMLKGDGSVRRTVEANV